MKKRPIFCDLKPAQDDSLVRRNHNCPEYDDCLSIAAFADLDLDCSFCSLKNANQAIINKIPLKLKMFFEHSRS